MGEVRVQARRKAEPRGAEIGGDEVAVLAARRRRGCRPEIDGRYQCPGRTEPNQYCTESPASACRSLVPPPAGPVERLEVTIKRADDHMYEVKRSRYSHAPGHDRRRRPERLVGSQAESDASPKSAPLASAPFLANLPFRVHATLPIIPVPTASPTCKLGGNLPCSRAPG